MASSGGKTFQEFGTVIAQAKKDGKSADEIAALQKTRDSLFQGNTLRGILLSAYGWWLVGSIALWAGIGLIIWALFWPHSDLLRGALKRLKHKSTNLIPSSTYHFASH
ncbi:hypothetical protein FRC0192_01138 [Corynebacterium diphtheriae]|nr:hypothetical protein FRC0192_01138 [Corynebacterium diphtheriae]